jgi:hypothetical protein
LKWKNFFFSFFRGKEKDIWFFAKNAVKRWAGSSTKLKLISIEFRVRKAIRRIRI